MSGIAGIIHADGKPVNGSVLQSMTEFMGFRGPDAMEIWFNGPVGLGHAMLCTTEESENARQPCSLDGQVWITADARIDGRSELIQKMAAKGSTMDSRAPDAELILHAYRLWGNNCVQHLIGDFAFAIWDEQHKRLFCARDHFGVKPFFYAQASRSILFSNTLNCLRTHPAISDELNEQAIADFLLYSHNRHAGQSAFADIRRLPPAHILTWSRNRELRCTPYWTLPVEKPIRYKRADDYVFHFRDLLRTAVSDRLRTGNVGVLMSGGLDSTSVAATAKELLSARSDSSNLQAFTFVYDRLIPDKEGIFAEMAADALKIPIHITAVDDGDPFEVWNLAGNPAPEPTDSSIPKRSVDQVRHFSTDLRVGLTGEGGDPALHLGPMGFFQFLKQLPFSRLSLDILKWRCSQGKWPKIGIRTSFKRWLGKRNHTSRPLYPPWLCRSLERRLNLYEQWQELNATPPSGESLRTEARQCLAQSMWAHLFESYDPGVTRIPVELRHPFFDLRLLHFLLALPPVPWCLDKELSRVAMRGILPNTVLDRPKAPLAGFPMYESLQKIALPDLASICDAHSFERFVSVDRFLKIAKNPQRLLPQEFELITRPLSLAVWLKNHRPASKHC